MGNSERSGDNGRTRNAHRVFFAPRTELRQWGHRGPARRQYGSGRKEAGGHHRARLVRIEQAQTYPKDYHELTEIAKKELRAGARPPLKNAVPDMAGVAYLFLGYPKFKKVNQFKPILLIA